MRFLSRKKRNQWKRKILQFPTNPFQKSLKETSTETNVSVLMNLVIERYIHSLDPIADFISAKVVGQRGRFSRLLPLSDCARMGGHEPTLLLFFSFLVVPELGRRRSQNNSQSISKTSHGRRKHGADATMILTQTATKLKVTILSLQLRNPMRSFDWIRVNFSSVIQSKI